MLTHKFKVTVGVVAGVVVAAGLVTNQAIEHKQIDSLQHQLNNRVQTVKEVMVTPTATPTPTVKPTVTPKKTVKVSTESAK